MAALGKISQIDIFPIKSCGNIQVNEAIVTKLGLAHPENPLVVDRKWMVIDAEKGSFLTQRQLPKMALIKPRLEGDSLILSAPGQADLEITIQPPTGDRKQCRVWNLAINGYAYGEDVSKWLNATLERENLGLVCFLDDLEARKVKDVNEQSNMAHEDDYTIYSDYSAYMLISQASLDDLNKRLKIPVTMRSFRPNLTVVDCEPYAEDDWSRFQIGESKFYKIKHCVRCLLTTVNPQIGERNPDGEPLKTLEEYRSNKEMYGVSPMFGIHFSPDACDGNLNLRVKVGDEIKQV